MRNILAFLAALTLTVLVVGWYLGWYSVRSVPDKSGDNSFNIKINKRKIEKDIETSASEVQKAIEKKGEKVVDHVGEGLETPADPTPVTNTPRNEQAPAHPEHSHKHTKETTAAIQPLSPITQ